MYKKIVGLILTVFFAVTGFSAVDAAELPYGQLYKQWKDLNQRIKENPQNVDMLMQRGNIALQLSVKQYVSMEGAKEDFNRVLKLRADSADAYYGLGEYFRVCSGRRTVFGQSLMSQYIIAKQYGGPVRDFQTLLNSQNNAALFAYTMAIKNAKNNLGKFYIARGDMYSYMNNPSSAIADYNNAITNDKQNPLAYLKHGLINASYDNNQSIEDYTKAIELLQRHNAEESYDVIRPLLLNSAEYVDATYGDLLEIACLKRGELFRLANKNENAIEDFSKALTLRPKDTNILKHRAEAYAAARQYENAIADYDNILSIEPKDKTVKEAKKAALKQKKIYDKEMKKQKSNAKEG